VNENSVGLVETQKVTFAGPPNEILLEGGQKLGPVTVAYETYGELNDDRSNAVLIVHALSGDAHVAGYHSPDDDPGWWEIMVGPGKGIDTNKYFVICSNVIGGCQGTTGPASINPATGKPYGLSFPVVTISDMVRVQKMLIDHLGIKKLLNIIGGSMGGLQVLEWAVSCPDSVASVSVIASTYRSSPQQIAFHEVFRNAIYSDPNWNNGDYYDGESPAKGLAVARMLGHITYLSDESMDKKFGRRLRHKEEFGYDFTTDFEVESYLRHQGHKFVERFDANSLLYITKAMDYFDLTEKYGPLPQALKRTRSKFLVMSFSSDWLFPPYQSKEIVKGLMASNKDVTYCEVQAAYGHDAFLVESNTVTCVIRDFIAGVAKENLENNRTD
jgi:homoserine O-acetyltransferase/O-succinyltransferase